MILPNTASISIRSQRTIEDFRGNFEELAVFMQRSWAENKSQPLLYTEGYLKSCFSYPGASFSLAPALYEDSRIVGFIAGFPRRMHYKGKELQIIVVSFLTVASEYKRSGYGIILWSELVKRARAAGFVGLINYCVDREPMANMMLGCFQRMKVRASRIYSIRYLTRLMQQKQSMTDQEDIGQGLVEGFVRTASRMADDVPLARVWSLEEAEWQCRRRAGSIVVSHSSGGRKGFLTGYVMHVADRDKTKCLLIEDVLWNDLEGGERQALVQRLVERSATLGARMAVVALQGYADPEAFFKSRFLRSSRLLHAYLGLWDEGLDPEPLSSIYVDVF